MSHRRMVVGVALVAALITPTTDASAVTKSRHTEAGRLLDDNGDDSYYVRERAERKANPAPRRVNRKGKVRVQRLNIAIDPASIPTEPKEVCVVAHAFGDTEETFCEVRAIPVDADPNDPAAAARKAQAQARAVAFVEEYFEFVPLPQPEPEISAQDGGICGVEHTLDLHLQPEMVFREPGTPFGALDFHVYGEINVDWGDGTSNVYTDGGAPYPNSVIRHVWTTKGTYDISATAAWSADFTLGPYEGFVFQGVLEGATTVGAVDDFQVFDAQAVLVS